MTWGNKFSKGTTTPPSWRTQARGRIDSGSDLLTTAKRGRMPTQGLTPSVFSPVIAEERAIGDGGPGSAAEPLGSAWLASSEPPPAAAQRRIVVGLGQPAAPVFNDDPVLPSYARRQPDTWGFEESDAGVSQQLADFQQQEAQQRAERARDQARRAAEDQAWQGRWMSEAQAQAERERRRRAQEVQDQADWDELHAGISATPAERVQQAKELADGLRGRRPSDDGDEAALYKVQQERERRLAEEQEWAETVARLREQAQGQGHAVETDEEASAALPSRSSGYGLLEPEPPRAPVPIDPAIAAHIVDTSRAMALNRAKETAQRIAIDRGDDAARAWLADAVAKLDATTGKFTSGGFDWSEAMRSLDFLGWGWLFNTGGKP